MNIKKRLNTPRTPRPTTHIPITAPLENAMESPLARLLFVPSAVRPFAMVAIRIPIFPESAERIAPIMNAIGKPISILLPSINEAINKSIATILTKTVSTLYSLFKNAIAPSLIALVSSRISLFPGSCLLTLKYKKAAKRRAIKPPNGIVHVHISKFMVSSPFGR